MKTTHPLFVSTLALLSGIVGAAHVGAAQPTFVAIDPDSGLSSAVVVEDKALAHTTQLYPLDETGAVLGATLNEQLAVVVDHLKTALDEVGSALSLIARLNVYVSSDALAREVESLLAAQLGPDSHPACTIVVTPLADPKALVALDAVAAVKDDRAPKLVLRHASPNLPPRRGGAHVTVLPKGRTLYISGMAESTPDLVKATVGTMKQLHRVLALNKTTHADVVHLKTFVKPMSEVATVEKIMAAYYPDSPAPGMSYVEWRNGLPIEIELIAHLPTPGDGAETVELRWQPEEKRSPVYCRFAIVDSPTRIYTKGFLAEEASDANSQIHSIYNQLKQVILPLGSDLRHLVKATYYHSADDTSVALNEIRPEYYDPERPPAASKALITGTGDAKRSMLIDMIAVPKP